MLSVTEWAVCTSKVLAISSDDKFVDCVTTSNGHTDLALITDRTCFYAESGGQTADTGTITNQVCCICSEATVIILGWLFAKGVYYAL